MKTNIKIIYLSQKQNMIVNLVFRKLKSKQCMIVFKKKLRATK